MTTDCNCLLRDQDREPCQAWCPSCIPNNPTRSTGHALGGAQAPTDYAAANLLNNPDTHPPPIPALQHRQIHPILQSLPSEGVAGRQAGANSSLSDDQRKSVKTLNCCDESAKKDHSPFEVR